MVCNSSFSNVCCFFYFRFSQKQIDHLLIYQRPKRELVAGYQTEYSGMMYAMFWLGEYANILLMCAMGSVLFLGGWLPIIDIYPF